MNKRKPKKCRNCGELFTPFQTTQVACSVMCAMAIGKAKTIEKEKKKHNKRKREFYENDTAFQKKKAQAIFNAFIRERDKHLPCISCDTIQAKWDAGHYKSRGAFPELAFNEDNCHKQCMRCNQHLSGNQAEYRARLIEKIGKEAVLELECYHEPVKRTARDYISIQKKYKNKLKALKSGQSSGSES